jgi:hypothetical protein
MPTRAGMASVAQVGKLQEARASLEKLLGFPVAVSLRGGLRLVAHPPPGRETEVPGHHLGFPIVSAATAV